MTIEILGQRTYTEAPNSEAFRYTKIIITSGLDSYLWGVGGLPVEGDLQAILDTREAELLASAIAAGVVPNTEETEENRDFYGLIPVINDELIWIDGAIEDIDTGLGIVDTATLAQLRAIVWGLLQNQRRVLLEQKRELKAWRYTIRQTPT